MKKLISLITAATMLLCTAGNVVFASSGGGIFGSATPKEFVWTASASEGTVNVESVYTIKNDAALFSAYGASEFEMTAEKSHEGAYAMDFSMLMYDFNAKRTLTVSGVDILSIDKNGAVTSGSKSIMTAETNKWYDAQLFVYPSDGTYKLTLEGNTIEGTATLSELEGIKLSYSQADEKGAITLISDPVISSLPEAVSATAKTEITSFIQTQGSAPTYVRERIEDPTGSNRGAISHLKLNGAKWMEGRQNASFSGLSEVNVDWYFNDFGAEQNGLAARMNSASGTWNEFVTFRHSDKKIVLGNKNSTDVIGSDYTTGEWYNIKLILDFDNSIYYVYVHDENMNEIASGSKAMDSSFESVAVLSLYVGNSTLSNASRVSSLYVDNYCYRAIGDGAVIETVPFDGKKNAPYDGDIIITSANIIEKETLEAAELTLNGETVDYTLELVSPEQVKVIIDLYEDEEYELVISGLTDIFGTELPVSISFETASIPSYGELTLDTESDVVASLPVEYSSPAEVFAVIYDENGQMLNYSKSHTENDEGAIEASVSGDYDNAAAYAWDSDMNIITPAIKTKADNFAFAQPCDISIIKTDYDNNIVTVKGTANRAAAIMLKDLGGNTITVKEVNALANGYFETQFKTDYYGDVILYINAQDEQGMQEITDIVLYSSEQLVDIVDEFNPDTDYVPDYKELIEKYADLFGFDSEEYSKISASDFAALMTKAEGEYETVSDVINGYNYAVAVGMFNFAEDAEAVKELIGKYSEAYGLTETETYAYYEKSSQTVQNKVFENLAKRTDYTSMDDVKAEFEAQAVLSAIECATVNSEILPILKANNDYLKLDFSTVNKLKSTSAVTGEMRGKAYASIEEMKDNFNDLADAALKKQNSSSSSSSGSSSFGGGVTLPSTKVDLPVTSEVVEDVKSNGKTFEDIKTVAWAEECIIYLSDRNIINGKSETHFMPLDNVTRAEFVKIISLAFPSEAMNTARTPFADVDGGAWYGDYVADAYNRGLITGMNDTTFGVNDNITRQDIAVILYRIAEKENISIDKTKTVLFYDDSDISDYAKTAVTVFAQGGIINGASDNMFMPKNYATRAEAAKLVYCLLKLTESE